MPSPKSPVALLQPLPATDPLAALFNDWLRGLEPVERLTRARPSGKPDDEDEETREQLRDATTTLHTLHRALTRAIALLSQEAPLAKLAPLFRPPGTRREGVAGIGDRYAESFEPLLSYVALQGRITTRAEFKRLLRYGNSYRLKLAERAAGHPSLERTIGLFLAVFDTAREAEQDFFFLQPDDRDKRASLLASLHGLVALNRFGWADRPYFENAACLCKTTYYSRRFA